VCYLHHNEATQTKSDTLKVRGICKPSTCGEFRVRGVYTQLGVKIHLDIHRIWITHIRACAMCIQRIRDQTHYIHDGYRVHVPHVSGLMWYNTFMVHNTSPVCMQAEDT
jgi:hypothetical protein